MRTHLTPLRSAGCSNSAYFICEENGSLFGNGKHGTDPQGYPKRVFGTGDHIGMLLDLDAGWMRFFINGVRCRIGVPSGMKGPYVRAVVFWEAGLSAMALPIAVRDARPTPVGSRWCGARRSTRHQQ